MKTLTLQITRENFEYILTGEQKVEHRNVYLSNVKKYVEVNYNLSYEDGLPYAVPVKYDALYLINGRRKDAPRLLVEVIDAEWVTFAKEDKKGITYLGYIENGKDVFESQIWYHLGKVIKTENVAEDFEFKFAGKVPYEYGIDDDYKPICHKSGDATMPNEL